MSLLSVWVLVVMLLVARVALQVGGEGGRREWGREMDHTLQSVFHWIAVGKWAVQTSMTEVAMTSHQTTKNLDPSDRSGFTKYNYQRQLVVSLPHPPSIHSAHSIASWEQAFISKQ